MFKVHSKYKFLAMLYVKFLAMFYVLDNEHCKQQILLGKHAIGELVRVSL
jgi:hypothetical protein